MVGVFIVVVASRARGVGGDVLPVEVGLAVEALSEQEPCENLDLGGNTHRLDEVSMHILRRAPWRGEHRESWW